MSARIIIDTSDWDYKSEYFRTGLDKVGPRTIEEGSAVLEEQLRIDVPVRTGNLRAGVTRLSISNTSAIVGTTSGYGNFVNRGVGPRVIRGKPILRFEINGVVFFRRKVNFPGFPGRRFKEKAVANAVPKIRDVISNILREETGVR